MWDLSQTGGKKIQTVGSDQPHDTMGFKMRFILAACAALAASPALAWTLDSSTSAISYVTMKNGDTAEANLFTAMSGEVSEDGLASLEIYLASVETFIEIRNERVRDVLFQVSDHPMAKILAGIDLAALDTLEAGETTETAFEVSVVTHGMTATYDANAYVTRASENRVVVSSKLPLIVHASDFGYTEGIARLQELAGLDSIQDVVPVTFNLTFER